MTTAEVLWALGFAGFGFGMLGFGIYFGRRSTRLTDNVRRFNRDDGSRP